MIVRLTPAQLITPSQSAGDATFVPVSVCTRAGQGRQYYRALNNIFPAQQQKTNMKSV